MALNYYGVNTAQAEIGMLLRPYQNPQGNNDDKAVSLKEMSGKGMRRGFTVFYRANGDINKLKQFTSNWIPVIVTTWLKPYKVIGHYRVVTGYDDTKQVIIQNDLYQGPNRTYRYIEFLGLWQSFN